ncbi:MAG TPA: nuclear transport factor 2 family protein [Solirubrobacterales bacterium]
MDGLLVRGRVTAMFDSLSAGDWDTVVSSLADDVHHVFPGDHPLGGERNDREAVRRWFERLGRLYPEHEFTVHRVMASGRPWDLWISAQWTARLRPRVGEPYENEGSHWIRVRWGKVTHFHAYLDTQRIAEACRQMAEAGVEEAAAAPIAS